MSDEGILEIIKATSLFEGLDDEALAFIANEVVERTYEAGEVVTAEGSLGDSMFIIRSGSVDVILNRGSKDMVKLAKLSVGDFAGEMTLIDSQPRSATLVASRVTDILVFSKSAMLALHDRSFESFMKVVVNITRRLANRLRETDKILASLAR